MKPLKIIEVKHLGGHKLSIAFDDGKITEVDFSEFLESSLHPQIQKYKEMDHFLSFTLDNGDLEWNDYDLCFPIYDLYTGEIIRYSGDSILI